ncbi:MAG TPA: hypothetical protein VGV64_00820 [Thermoplasmata archaeon]|nr:hypothetical protein [Thermoplasmata archaeon]HZY69842.1 hypothetical protein [Thermoplasmata archaeon]
MRLRTIITFVNIGVFVGIFALQFVYPPIQPYAFWALLAYFVASLLFVRSPILSRDIGRPKRPVSAPPLPSSGGSGAPSVGFCIYCGHALAEGAAACSACGRARPLL